MQLFCLTSIIAALSGNRLCTPYKKKLLILQKIAVRIIEGIYPPQSASQGFKKYYFLKVQDIAKMQMMLVMHRYICNILPEPMQLLFNVCINSNYWTRQSKHFQCIFSNTNYRLFTIACLGPKLWNNRYYNWKYVTK